MTIARDRITGQAIGQVLDETPALTLERDPKARRMLFVLTRDGYTTIPAASVRLEEVRD